MKSNDAAGGQLLATRTTSSAPVYRVLDDSRERSSNLVMLSVVAAAIVALYVAMFVSVYLWSRYAPLFSPDSVGNSATVEATPWR